MKVPKEESKEQNNDNTLNDDDNLSNPYDTESNSDSIDPPTRDGDFSEYMWMENQEEFDLQVNQGHNNHLIYSLLGTYLNNCKNKIIIVDVLYIIVI